MISFSLRSLSLFCAVCTLGTRLPAEEPPIIAKARAFLGSEAALNAVKSVHYTGKVVTTDAADPSKQTQVAIEIIVQKPDQQRVVVTSDKAVETTALDGYEAWRRTVDKSNSKNSQMVILKPDAVKRLRAQAWENVSSFRGIERRGGRIEDNGIKTLDGVPCQKLAFIYAPQIIFYRYFDPATGRLVATETEEGGITREEGTMIVNGVKFPKTMKMLVKGPKGAPQTVTITLETITVNETFPAAVFRMPSPGS